MTTAATETATMFGWHFLPESRCLQHSRSKKAITEGSVTKVRRPLELCRHGLHASERAIDSLQFAPGPIVCRVELSGEILRGSDKACATERRVLWMADATRTLHEFAVWCARGALERQRATGHEPDPRSWAALDAKLAWLNGEITEQELAAARDAARNAARNAAWDAAWDAARDAQNTELERRLMALAPVAAQP